MTTENKPAATEASEKAKTFVGIFTPAEAKGPKVELFRNISDNEKAPLFGGTIDGQKVSAFLRQGPKSPFLSIVDNEKGGEGKQIATANVRTRENGAPMIVIDKGEEKIFASVSKKVEDDLLVKMGLNLETQAEKRAKFAADAAAPEAEKKASPKP